MRYVIIDESTPASALPQYGGPLAQADLLAIAAALQVQLDRDLATHWGGDHVVRVGASPADTQAGETVCAIVDDLPQAPGDVAYHDVTGAELPVVFLARSQCQTIRSGSQSVASALGHELCEAEVDPYCNEWIDAGDGTEVAKEACDCTQEDTYEIDGITVPNFTLPAFFAAGSAGPWTYLGAQGHETVPAALGTAPGGYQIKRPVGGKETQVTGEIHASRRAKKAHWSSRTSKRGVQA